jgi:hypothetical protein
MANDEYVADKQYLVKTIEKASQDIERIYDKLDTFKLETTKSIAVIQTKLALYVAVGSSVASVVVGVTIKVLS